MPKPQSNCLVGPSWQQAKRWWRAGLDTLAKSIGIGYWQ